MMASRAEKDFHATLRQIETWAQEILNNQCGDEPKLVQLAADMREWIEIHRSSDWLDTP